MNATDTTTPNATPVAPSEVAMLCNGDEFYGIGTIIKLYAKGLPDMRFVCFSDGAMYQWLKERGADVRVFDGINRFTARGSLSTLMSMPKIKRKARADGERLHKVLEPLGVKVLHTHRLPQQLTSGHMRRFGYKTAWQINNNMTRSRMMGIGQKLNWKMARWGADILLPASDFIAANWTGSGVKSVTVRNAAEPLHEMRNVGSEYPVRCLVAGRIDETKGHHTAIRAVLDARAKGADVTLDVFGGPLDDNDYADRLRAMIKDAEADASIRLMGFCTDLRERHGDYHLGLQCRIDPEPCSLWVCETMVDGLPLLASSTGGTPELIDEGVTGYLYPPADAEALSALLVKLTDRPDTLRTMREAAYRRGRESFTLDRFVRETFDAYASVLA
ncbi:MAG: glycosyltransferase family 4 protein [Phycisphaeraceae bacterium]